MSALEFADVISLGSLSIAALALIASMLRSHKTDAAKDQMLRDRLEQISEMTKETRDSVRELNTKIDDHTTRLVRAEESIKSLDKRLEKLEFLNSNLGVGGSD